MEEPRDAKDARDESENTSDISDPELSERCFVRTLLEPFLTLEQ